MKFFSTFVFIFALLDPDPDMDPLTWLNPDPKICLSGRVADPDPHQGDQLDLAEWLERLTVPIAKVATSVADPDPWDPYVYLWKIM